LLLKSALTGTQLPDYLLYQAIKRMKVDPNPKRNDKEDSFTLYARMMLIRLVFNSYPDKEENYMSQLDMENHDPAYLCGRLLAVLENIQYLAVPGAKATLIDRYYGSASSAPASVFGTLMRGTQAHLAKLRKEKEGAYFALQKRLEDICSGLPAYPATLNMKDQAIFALGYYHQRAEDRSARTQAKAKDKPGQN
jgi:CRISPR-associated protein Csd1